MQLLMLSLGCCSPAERQLGGNGSCSDWGLNSGARGVGKGAPTRPPSSSGHTPADGGQSPEGEYTRGQSTPMPIMCPPTWIRMHLICSSHAQTHSDLAVVPGSHLQFRHTRMFRPFPHNMQDQAHGDPTHCEQTCLVQS